MQKQVALHSRERGDFPTLWAISGGRPDTLIEAAGLKQSSRWPIGIYEGAPAYQVMLVVTSELPVVPETLLLRLWGAGKTLKRAQAELRRLPTEAWERKIVKEAVVAFASTSPYAEKEEGAAMIEEYRKVVDQWKEEVWQDGVAKGESIGIAKGESIGIAKGESIGIAKGESIGIAKGETLGLHEALETIYESGFGPLSEPLQTALRTIQAPDRLRMLISLFISQSQSELDSLLLS
jgi:hypothetical protein